MPAVIVRLQTCAWQTQGSLVSSSSSDGRLGIGGAKEDTPLHVGTLQYHQPSQTSATCGSLPIYCSLLPCSKFFFFFFFFMKSSILFLCCPLTALESKPPLWKDPTCCHPTRIQLLSPAKQDEPCSGKGSHPTHEGTTTAARGPSSATSADNGAAGLGVLQGYLPETARTLL